MRLFAFGFALVAAMIASGATAQTCDDRYPWTCPGYAPPAPPPAGPDVLPPAQPGPGLAPSGPGTGSQPSWLQPGWSRPGWSQPSWSRPGRGDPSAGQPAARYAAVRGEPFPIDAVDLSGVDPRYLRQVVHYPTREEPGTIVIDPTNRFLYLVEEGGRALRYGVGVGREGFGWSGAAVIKDKQEWPDWYPPKEMIARQPELRRQLSELQSGLGVPGGPRNPLGSRAMYLWQDNKDTLYRIHGTLEPWTIGRSVSSGCIRMINQDVIDLYERTPLGTRVVVLPAR